MARSAGEARAGKGGRGVVTLAEREARMQRISILVLTIGPFAGFLGAVASLWGRGITALDLSILFLFYVISGLGVTVGFHRLLTHRSFDAPPSSGRCWRLQAPWRSRDR